MASLSLFASPSLTLTLTLTTPKPHLFTTRKPQTISCASQSAPSLTGPNRTLTTLASVAFSATKLLPHNSLLGLKQALLHSAGPAFFAAIKNQPVGPLNTPLTLVAAGLAKWLDIYSGVLMVRVLLSWFPNIPWERQPLSAIRDLCDPYLNLFRNIIPPIFDTLDVSPLLAFAVLGTLGSILNSTRGSY